jgi:hypothetical protein
MSDEYLPEASDVASILRARTYNDESKLEGEWSTETRPTLDQVIALIQRSYVEVAARVGQVIEEESPYFDYAKNVVAIRAAMWVELSYFPEQSDEDRDTVYKELKELYAEELGNLIASLPDSTSTKKGIYSLRMRSDVSGVFPTSELLP